MKKIEQFGHAYFFAKKFIIHHGYADEIEWQDRIDYKSLTESELLRESAWVILASGLSDKVVRNKFPAIKDCLFQFQSAPLIVKNKRNCFQKCLTFFNHPGKINAILYVAEQIISNTFEGVKNRIERDGIDYLKTFPYLGNATAFHLAKNIGLNVAKPDRHLVRMAEALGYTDPHDLCVSLATVLQEKVSLVDLVLWRYATLDRRYLEKVKWMANRQISN